MMDSYLWGITPFGFHLTSVLLHIAVGSALFWLVVLLSKNEQIALWTALIYVVHPVHTEAVAYVAGRADSLCALFILLSIIFY